MATIFDVDAERPLFGGADYRTLLGAAETGGTMAIVEAIHEPGTGPGRHIHATHDEVFVVLSGRLRFAVGAETFERGPGGAAFVARGADHTFQVVGEETARFLVILTPPGFEGFLEEWLARRWRMPEDVSQIAPAAERVGLIFTGPPIAA